MYKLHCLQDEKRIRIWWHDIYVTRNLHNICHNASFFPTPDLRRKSRILGCVDFDTVKIFFRVKAEVLKSLNIINCYLTFDKSRSIVPYLILPTWLKAGVTRNRFKWKIIPVCVFNTNMRSTSFWRQFLEVEISMFFFNLEDLKVDMGCTDHFPR